MTLRTDTGTWLLFGAVTVLWLLAAVVVVWRRRRAREVAPPGGAWRALLLTLFGFAWLAFGVAYILRFAMLAYDPVLFQASRFPPWRIPTEALNHTWLLLGVYWLALCAGAAAVVVALPARVPRFLRRIDLLDALANAPALDLLACASGAALVLLFGLRLPGALRTPVGHVAGLWVIPAALAWHMHLRGAPIGARRYLYLLPGLLLFVLSPYREHLLGMFLCVALPAVALRRGAGSVKMAALAVAVLLISSVALYVYRPLFWGGESWESSRRYADWGLWRQRPDQAPWTKLSRRFHGFDSAALTLWLVPEAFPHEQRNLAGELAVSALVPRAFYAGKERSERGRLFSTTIWAYDVAGEPVGRSPAMIAPSMPGDLWAAGGARAVVLGALAWGALIGLLEWWRRGLRSGPAVALVAFLAFRVAGGMERDFVHACATIAQVVIVALLVLALVPMRKRRSARATAARRSASEASPS